jgi:CobQ-like glutamine amidotransferase family enzyme
MTGRDGTVIPGLELIPVSTAFGSAQHVTIGARVTVGDRSLIGVENHNATVTIDTPARAFGAVTRGFGNDGGDFDGYAHGSLVATHLHGPLFALNAVFADEFCSAILARRGTTFERGDALDALDALSLAAAVHLDRQAKS